MDQRPGNKEIYCATGEYMLLLSTFSIDHYQSADATDASTVSIITIRSIPNPPVGGNVRALRYRIVFGYAERCPVERCRNLTTNDNPFNKDAVQDVICNPYFGREICYRGMIVRSKGVRFLSIPLMVSDGHTNRSKVMIYGGTPR